jgi:high-affinity K+ transport system ATPase subunit B
VSIEVKERPAAPVPEPPQPPHAVKAGAFNPRQLWASMPEALRKRDPRTQLRNPVMFVVWVGSVVVTVMTIIQPTMFGWWIAVWSWRRVRRSRVTVMSWRGSRRSTSRRSPAMGIRTVMITGDNPRTARAIAAEAGVDDHLAEATPEDKMALIRKEQEGGRLVAMTGDGTNDAPALAQADVGVAMNTGTAAAKEAGNMVDLDSDPTKLIEIVEIGKQLLITRGALTTFSIANDLAKYFAILPAMFVAIYPSLGLLNIMHLATPQSAILSAVIFNALIIVALIPLALRGVQYRPTSAANLLRRNLLIYGLGGVVMPFVGIFVIDLLVRLIPGI